MYIHCISNYEVLGLVQIAKHMTGLDRNGECFWVHRMGLWSSLYQLFFIERKLLHPVGS